ncbi:hypothetical protein HaLaN_12229, partial [Haematococcus lacustris]
GLQGLSWPHLAQLPSWLAQQQQPGPVPLLQHLEAALQAAAPGAVRQLSPLQLSQLTCSLATLG